MARPSSLTAISIGISLLTGSSAVLAGSESIPARRTSPPARSTAPSPTGDVNVKPGSARKICQMTGQTDSQLKPDGKGQPQKAPNKTEETAKLRSTDLGFSCDHTTKDGKSKTYFFYGDSFATQDIQRPRDADSIAVTTDKNPDDCIQIDFLKDEKDGGFRQIKIEGLDPQHMEAMEVPTGCFSVNGDLYMTYASSYNFEKKVYERSILAVSKDDGKTWKQVHDMPKSFTYAASKVVKAEDLPGIPEKTGNVIVLFGTGDRYRQTSPRLAYIHESKLGSKDAIKYMAGTRTVTGADDKPKEVPVWSAKESDAVELFDSPCISESSVDWNEHLGKWIMIYNCDTFKGVSYRVADAPHGPWSNEKLLFNSWKDGGYCGTKPGEKGFLHAPPDELNKRHLPPCDSASDPGNNKMGEIYAPALIPRYTKGVKGKESTIYFQMSTWNPYQSVLGKATLEADPPKK